ncbi:MAG TPA: hypothetical protein VFC26_13675 [Verrucomicrobiae bacterium]|nr:hypothetical protein [Verrucomicrobiae bacterium]
MPQYTITSPNGKTYDVTAPDGASQEDILAFVQSQTGTSSPQELAAQAKSDAPADPISAGGRFMKGLRDPLDAGAQMLVNALPEGVTEGAQKLFGPEFAPNASQMNERQAQAEREYQARRESAGSTGLDVARMGGSMVSTAPLAAALPGAGATVLGGVARGAVSGAVQGAMQPVTDETKTFWSEKGNQAAVGAATGGASQGLLNLARKWISPNVSADVKMLRTRGITPLPGQMIGRSAGRVESMTTSFNPAVASAQRGAIEDFNRAAYNEVLAPVGMTYPKDGAIGREGIKYVGDQLSKKYDDLLPNLTFGADHQLLTDATAIQQMVASLPKKEARYFAGFWKDKLGQALAPNGQMDGRTFKEIQEAVGKESAAAGKSTDIYQRKLGDAFDALKSSLDDALERSNPQHAGELQKINQGWANLVPLEHAATAVSQNGVFTPAQLLQGVRTASDTVRKRGFVRGTGGQMQELGEAGQKVLGNAYPDSGTAGRALLGAGVLGGAGMMFNPATAVGLGASMLGYTGTGKRAIASALADRPNIAPQISAAVRKASVPARTAMILALLGKPVPPAAQDGQDGY